MGAKDSKPCCITYEDALKRVSEAEIKRLRDAFKRVSNINGLMTKQAFIKDVLGDGMPGKLAEHIFQACGGSLKGIGFKDLLCGLVLLTRGYKDEKIKFIFGLYSNEAGTHVSKQEMVQLVQACEGGYIPEAVADCFIESEKVPYDEFGEWLLQHPDATSLTRWLLSDPCTVSLSNDLEMPTFYQTLAGVTHLEEADIIELEKRYWMLKAYSRTGKFDFETFLPLVCPPIPHCLCEGFFNAFDENRDDHIDFKEMACGISACCRGPVVERQKFCFKVFDSDRDGALSPKELLKMVEALIYVRTETHVLHHLDDTVSDNPFDTKSVLEDILTHFDANKDGAITLDEYLVWSVSHPLPESFLNLLFQVCHIVLGLKPANREDEATIIRDWLDREEKRGFHVGQVWYLVSMEWWKTWHDYINHKPMVGIENPNYRYANGGITNNNTSSLSRSSSATGSLKKMHKKAVNAESAALRNGDDNEHTAYVSAGETDDHGGLLQSHAPTSTSSINKSNGVMPSPNGSPRILRKPMSGQSQFYLSVQRPAAIDNTSLVVTNLPKATILTGEGGKLKRNIVMTRGRDFELVPEPVWKALSQWYGGSPALPRQVILPSGGRTPELELFPLCIRLLRHQIPNVRAPPNTWSGVVGGYGAPTYGYPTAAPAIPRRYLAYLASFSRLATLKQVVDFLSMRLRIRPEDIHLWHYKDENNMTLLEDEGMTLEQLRIDDNDQILIEVRNKDQTWPEEMSLLANRSGRLDRKKQVPTEKGATGLNNLGNTCFMNAALQCVSNTRPLTQYFINNMHLYELNRNNPLGMKGIIAKRYGDLIQDLWSGTSKTIAPLKLRWTIGKYAPRFNGFQQHDSQELLAFLLDGLHEDLNRVHDKPYVELKDSDGRSDVIVAQEAWENHILRNKSIIVDLFHGQLKSRVRCKVCSHESVRFDPFNYLSLPLPMESCVHLEVIVIRLDGAIPVKYGLRLNAEEKYHAIKQQLSELCDIPADQLMLAEVIASMIKTIPSDEQRVRTNMNSLLFAYEIPCLCHSAAYEDVRAVKQQQEPQTLTQIQRMDRGGILARMSNRASGVNEASNHEVRNGECHEGMDKQSMDNDVVNEDSSQTTDDSGHCTLAEVHSSCSKHCRNPSNMSSSSNSSSAMSSSFLSTTSQGEPAEPFCGFVIASHRKMIRQDVYFLSSQKTRPSVFGLPLVLPCSEMTSHQDLYQATWAQVAHLVSPLPPTDTNVPNHAQDCDDSLGYEYPFILKAVQKDGLVCAWCPWYRFCRGCKIECNDTNFNFASKFIAIDWDPTALHLRYQASQERITVDHESVERTRRLQTDPIDLDSCLRAFTKEEELGEDEKYYCCKCKQHQLASKKLQIWRLPPVLIVHLKRFQFVNGHWVKSQKIVKFPYEDFDPTDYLATIPRRAVYKHKGLTRDNSWVDLAYASSDSSGVNSQATTPTTNESHGEEQFTTPSPDDSSDSRRCIVISASEKDRKTDLPSSPPVILSNGLGTAPTSPETNSDTVITSDVKSTRSSSPSADVPQDFHQHRVQEGYDPFDLKYHLYAISCHSGILGGGHYVCYACNANNRWYCYNDSSCKEVSTDQIDADSSYMLFYERQGIDYDRYLPNVSGKLPDTRDIDDEIESDFRKLCCLQ